jgi:rRNA maturation RNase YbeY
MPAGRADGPRVSVRGAGNGRVCPAAFLRRAVRATLARAAPAVLGDIAVVLTGDRKIRELNRTFRGIDRATDVLSFDIGDGLEHDEPLGDIVISVETARRQAHEYGAPLRTELARLVVHGTLHLCGYDHREPREAARMHGMTRRLVRELTGA